MSQFKRRPVALINQYLKFKISLVFFKSQNKFRCCASHTYQLGCCSVVAQSFLIYKRCVNLWLSSSVFQEFLLARDQIVNGGQVLEENPHSAELDGLIDSPRTFFLGGGFSSWCFGHDGRLCCGSNSWRCHYRCC